MDLNKFQYDQYSKIGLQNLLLSTTFTFSSMVGFIFGMFFVVNEFFFSKNMRLLITLPYKPFQIISAKLLVVIIDQMWISFAVLLPMLVYFAVLSSGGVTFWISLVVVFIFSQIFPVLLQALVILPLSRVFKFSKHKDLLVMLLSVGVLCIVFLFQFYMNQSVVAGGMSESQISDMLANPNGFIQKISMVYPPALLAVNALTKTGFEWVGWLLAFVGLHVVSYYVILLFADKFYYSTYSELQEQYSKKMILKDGAFAELFGKKNTVFVSLTKREWVYFLKVPAFSLNGFVNVLVFPIMLLLFSLTKGSSSMTQLFELLDNYSEYIVPMGIIGATLSGAMNMLSVTVFSREGKLLNELKVLPVSPKIVFLVKYLQTLFMSLIGPITFVIAMGIIFKMAAIDLIVMLVVSVLCVNFLNLCQILIDAMKPVLNWDNPMKAMKQNINSFFSLMLIFAFCGGLGYLGFLLKDQISPDTMTITLALFGLIGSVVFWFLANKGVKKLLDNDLSI